MSQLDHEFYDEAGENLDGIERRLLAYEAQSDPREQIDAIFRCAHSIKGTSAALGFVNIAAFAHLVESALHRMRGEPSSLDTQAIDLLLESVDAMRALLLQQQKLSLQQNSGTVGAEVPAALEQRLRAVATMPEPFQSNRSLIVRLGPFDGTDELTAAVALFRDIAGLGTIEALRDEGSGVRAFAVRTDTSDEGLLALFAFHMPVEKVSILEINGPGAVGGVMGNDSTGNDADDAGPQSKSAAGRRLASPSTGGTGPTGSPVMFSGRAEFATLRVARAKVEELSRRVSALTHTGSLLRELSVALEPQKHPELFALLRKLQRETQELQSCARSIGMAPVGTVYQRFSRMLRELETKLGKHFALSTQGEEVELDKAMLEALADPLMHLVRNSCDHGIELPAERLAAGKPETGSITLSVEQRDGMALVEVRDDGRGLLRERILKAAEKRGLPVSAATPDADLWQLLFVPGFSTVDVASEISGRGVGMDVVRRSVLALKVTVAVSSTVGCGTTVSMRLPVYPS